ncbi:hypothetical protein WMY93_006763 [Mugilogobius chulae]|uniref:Reverse transcriptase domain-containing protein n=1 Tax=Mugilogobius chulae TaxID=88201 RepID=A0AAW0PKX6_9GOBI
MLIPVYKPKIKTSQPITKTVVTWPEDSSLQLQDCFQRTIWDVFYDLDIETYTSAVLCYIKTCIENVTLTKRIRVFPNRKPWMTKEVQLLLNERNAAFYSGDSERYRVARRDLKKGIKRAKAAQKGRIEEHFSTRDPAQMWHGIQQITNYRGNRTVSTDGSISRAEELNHFFARFEVTETEQTFAAVADQPLALREHEVQQMFRSVNVRKAGGPDGIPGRVIKSCAYQLAQVFTKIFNLSLALATVPTCLKTAIIIPVPKQLNITCLNDYRPVTLTSVVTKCLERLILKHIKARLPADLDPYQFAYRAHRSTEDAIITALHTVLQHLDQKGTYARLLFIDYSSAFNTIVPSRLIMKLLNLGLSSSLCMWIRDFLTKRPQAVRLGQHLSSTVTLSTGAPQGCVLSPLLYSLYTVDL